MTASLVQPFWYGGSAGLPTGVPLDVVREVGGAFGTPARDSFGFSVADTQFDLTAIPAPATTGTNYSYVQQIALEVISASFAPITTLSDASVRLTIDVAPGTRLFYRANATYLDQTIGSQGPPNVLTEDIDGQPTTPPGYDVVTLVPTVWDAMGAPGNGGTLGRATTFLDLVIGVTSAYAAGLPPHMFFAPLTVLLVFSVSER